MIKILIVGGANIAAIGRRERGLYGCESYESIKKELVSFARGRAELEFFESDREGELIERLLNFDCDALILNLGGFSHTSVALSDTMRSIVARKIEVHLTNVAAREPYRRLLTGGAADGVICGLGTAGYKLAIIGLTEEL